MSFYLVLADDTEEDLAEMFLCFTKCATCTYKEYNTYYEKYCTMLEIYEFFRKHKEDDDSCEKAASDISTDILCFLTGLECYSRNEDTVDRL